MFKRYIGKNYYSIIYLETDILTIINDTILLISPWGYI